MLAQAFDHVAEEAELYEALQPEERAEGFFDLAEEQARPSDYEVVIGLDDRKRVGPQTIPPSLAYPFNTICYFHKYVQGIGWRRGATGTLLTPQVVLTARHCLENGLGTGRWHRKIIVVPGFAGDLRRAHRHRKPARPNQISATTGRFRAHPTLDFGVIILPRPFRTPGKFMPLHPLGARSAGVTLRIAGYPKDKPFGTIWRHSEPLRAKRITSTRVHYTIDTYAGHSGSPVWLAYRDGRRAQVAVHTTGSSKQNSGVRITPAVIRQVRLWCREFGVSGPTVV